MPKNHNKLTVKQCSKCGDNRLLSEFPRGEKYKGGRRGVCKLCAKETYKAYYHRNPKVRTVIIAKSTAYREANAEKDKISQRRFYLKKTYGITLEQYDVMFEAQNGNCAICGLPEINKRLSVDHNHTTNKVRGLLCQQCNFAVGSYESMDIGKVEDYINAYK